MIEQFPYRTNYCTHAKCSIGITSKFSLCQKLFLIIRITKKKTEQIGLSHEYHQFHSTSQKTNQNTQVKPKQEIKILK